MADTEILAVAIVERYIAKTDFLVPYVKSKDREPILDGYICAYSDKKKDNAHEKGRADVQIKGRSDIKYNDETTSFSVTRAELECYRRQGGAILFVALFNPEDAEEGKLFYKALLPFDINKLLSKEEEQYSLILRPFPTEKTEIDETILTFVDNKAKNAPLISSDNPSLEDIFRDSEVPPQFSVGYIAVDGKYKNPIDYFFDHDCYIYLEGNKFVRNIPVEHMDRLEAVATETTIPVCVNEKRYFDRCHVEFRKRRIILDYTEGFHLGINDDKDAPGRSKVSYTFKFRGSLNTRIRLQEFVMAAEEAHCMNIGNERFEFYSSIDPNFAEFMDHVHKDSVSLNAIRKALDEVGCHEDLDMDNLTENDILRLNALIASVVEGKPVGFEDISYGFGKYKIANIELLLRFEKVRQGYYLLSDFNKWPYECKANTDNGSFPVSVYSLFSQGDFETVSNIDYKKAVDSICAYHNSYSYERATWSLLYMLKAYDNIGRTELLDSAEAIAKWLFELDIDTEKDTALLNVLQCRKRRHNLSGKDKSKLRQIIKMEGILPETKAGCYLLLDSSKKALLEIEKMEEEKKKIFLDYPLMRFCDVNVDERF